jgi:hypothetical protein
MAKKAIRANTTAVDPLEMYTNGWRVNIPYVTQHKLTMELVAAVSRETPCAWRARRSRTSCGIARINPTVVPRKPRTGMVMLIFYPRLVKAGLYPLFLCKA